MCIYIGISIGNWPIGVGKLQKSNILHLYKLGFVTLQCERSSNRESENIKTEFDSRSQPLPPVSDGDDEGHSKR